MNRSILIVICDFLLVSLLAFSTVDIGKMSDQAGAPDFRLEMATNHVAKHESSAKQDLGDVMRLALTEEKKSHDQLLGELANARTSESNRLAQISERENQIQNYQQQLRNAQERAAHLQEQQTNLQQQFATAQTNIDALNQKLQNYSTQNLISQESLAATRAEAQKQSNQTAELQRQLADLNKANQQAMAEKQHLSEQLGVAEAEKRSANDLALRMQDEVKVEREEKAKLAAGVQALASKSGELAQELHENTPLAPNTIFNQFVSNRVEADFAAYRSTLFNIDSSRHSATKIILVSDGTNTYALCHVQDTPLAFFNPGIDWESLNGTLKHESATVPMRSLSFYLPDPRIVMIPVSSADAAKLHGKVYHFTKDPFKFQDAVVVGTREDYYGQCRFEMDLSTPDYVRVDHNSLKGLFGQFNPSRGDLVFSRTGEFLGIMANSSYCLLINNLYTGSTIQCGNDIRGQHTGATLSILASVVQQKPFKLQ